MRIELIHVMLAIAVGLGATLIMDSWALLLKARLQHPVA
jgi:hypothetical protein